MESWSYISRGEGFFPGETVSATDGSARYENEMMGWELKASSTFETNASMSSNQEGLKNSQFVVLGSAQRTATTLDNVSVTDGKTYAISGQEESSPKLSGSYRESNFHDTSTIDLKLGRFPDQKDAQPNATNQNFSSAESSLPVKRPRAGKLSCQIPYCQVYGCKKDLSNSKDYHKRHKVCEIHTKTTKVIVNGIDQRFCQQCSRFHLLSEFDNGKRSCRKRLAGHNERRRKSSVGVQPCIAGRIFNPYNGTRFNGTCFAFSSFICQDRPSSGLLHAQKYETNDSCRNVRVENVADYVPQHGISYMKDNMYSNSHMILCNSESQYPAVHDDGLIAVTRSKINHNNSSILHNVSSSGFDPHSLFQNSSIGSDELTVSGSWSTGQRLPSASNSSCALSLLSFQSQNLPNIPSSIPTGVPLISPNSQFNYGAAQVPEKLMRASSQTSTSGISNAFPTSGITSADEANMETIVISDGIESDKYGINEFIPGLAEFRNAKNPLASGDGSTSSLLQLSSSQLQRVEHPRRYVQVKHADETLFGLRNDMKLRT